MNSIVCATRAGEGSRAVQQAAITLAKQTGRQLVFLYIIESRVYEALEEPMRPIVRAELYWLAKTLLRIAGNRAKEADLQPSLIIREGNVRDEISEVVKNVGASCLLLGAPRHRKANTFGEDAIIDFAKSIQQATGVNVQIEWPKEAAAYVFSRAAIE